MTQKYDNIVNLPHPTSQKYIRMSLHSRAAQFAPFAALTGHSESITETARMTDQKIELDEYMKDAINDNLQFLKSKIKEKPVVTITYFCPDKKKSGGEYIFSTGYIKKILENENSIIMSNKDKIYLTTILRIFIH